MRIEYFHANVLTIFLKSELEDYKFAILSVCLSVCVSQPNTIKNN
jgi:hypothetical protein